MSKNEEEFKSRENYIGSNINLYYDLKEKLKTPYGVIQYKSLDEERKQEIYNDWMINNLISSDWDYKKFRSCIYSVMKYVKKIKCRWESPSYQMFLMKQVDSARESYILERQEEVYAETSLKVDEYGTQFKQEIPEQNHVIESNEILAGEKNEIPIKNEEKIYDKDIEFDKNVVRLKRKLEILENAAILSSQKIMKLTEENTSLKSENKDWKAKVSLLEIEVKEKNDEINEQRDELRDLWQEVEPVIL